MGRLVGVGFFNYIYIDIFIYFCIDANEGGYEISVCICTLSPSIFIRTYKYITE